MKVFGRKIGIVVASSASLEAGQETLNTPLEAINFIYSSNFTSSLESGSLASVDAVINNTGSDGASGELLFRLSEPSNLSSSGSTILRMFHTGDNKEPRVGIGIEQSDTIEGLLDLRSPTGSSPVSIILRTNEDGVIEEGEETGRITFAIESSSYLGTGFIASGSTAAIYSRVEGFDSSGAYGSLIFEVNDNLNVTEPVEALKLGYGADPTFNGVGVAMSASMVMTSTNPVLRIKNDNGNQLVRLGWHSPTDQNDAQLLLYNQGNESVKLNGDASPADASFIRYGNFALGTTVAPEKLTVEGNISASGNIYVDELHGDGSNITGLPSAAITTYTNSGNNRLITSVDSTTVNGESNLTFDGSLLTINGTASVDLLQVDDKLQGNGSGFQFFAFNEDTTKVKFANWFTGTDNQYGMGMLWYETWFAAIDTDGNANDVNRRIGFYLEQPEAGATDSTSGETGRHPNNARFYVDITGSYVASGGLHVTDADFNVESNGNVEVNGDITVTGTVDGVDVSTLNISGSSNFTDNEFLVADGTHGVVSTDALAVDSSGNLGIGISTPEVRLHMRGESAQTAQFLMEQYNDTADAPDIRTRRFRGTPAAPADVQTGDYLFRINVEGRDGGSNVTYGSMQFDVDGTDQDALNWRIQTRDTGGTLADRITIDSAGDTIVAGEVSSNTIKNIETTLASDSATNVDTFATATYKGAIYDYVLYDAGVGARTGQFMVIQDNSNIDFTDNSTPTIGSEATIPSITAVINGSNVEVKVTNGNGYTFRAMAKKL